MFKFGNGRTESVISGGKDKAFFPFYYCRPYLPDIVGHQICNPADYTDDAKREANLKQWEDLASKGSENGITLTNRRAFYYKIYRVAGGLKPFEEFASR